MRPIATAFLTTVRIPNYKKQSKNSMKHFRLIFSLKILKVPVIHLRISDTLKEFLHFHYRSKNFGSLSDPGSSHAPTHKTLGTAGSGNRNSRMTLQKQASDECSHRLHDPSQPQASSPLFL